MTAQHGHLEVVQLCLYSPSKEAHLDKAPKAAPSWDPSRVHKVCNWVIQRRLSSAEGQECLLNKTGFDMILSMLDVIDLARCRQANHGPKSNMDAAGLEP